ncbi:hypothetical protein SAMN05421797_10532 [Maribacter ulvicola]|uniref:Uncharacterized protein n=1 Tax=Maribacter ulvicola TaxID=228959 RepID=A0A1N6X940_9FLAO|nr:hypothetical protein SAMN05421797_10532 [Maribacter ulvicola]
MQTFFSEQIIETFDQRVIGKFSRTLEVKLDSVLIDTFIIFNWMRS